MDQRPHAANPPESKAAEDTPLRRYLAALDQGDDLPRLQRQIRMFVVKADLPGEQPAQEIALEVFQETVVEALRSEANFDATRSALLWLVGIAANVVKRRRAKLFRLRRNESVTTELTRAGELTEEQLFDRIVNMTRPGPEQAVLVSMELEAMLAQLGAEDRRIIELYALHELNAGEVAHALGITSGAARVRLHRTYKKLRKIGQEQATGREEKQNDE